MPADTTTLPVPATALPPIGPAEAPAVPGSTSDAVAEAAQATYAAYTAWQASTALPAQHRRNTALVAALRADLARRWVVLAPFVPGGRDGALRPGHDAASTAGAVDTAATAAAGEQIARRLEAATALLGAARTRQQAAELDDAARAHAYRVARDDLADQIARRTGRPAADATALSAAWETADPRRLGVVYAALMHVGEAYVFAAEGPNQFDCSGLTRMAWKTAGIDLVHYAITQREQTIDEPADGLRPGDLVFRFQQPGGHVMIYLGVADLIVQAGGTSTGVTVGSWGHTDGFGSPLGPVQASPPPAATGTDSTPPAAPAPPVWFGPGAGNTAVVADVPYAAEFNAAGRRANVAPALLAAIAAVSTGFRAKPQNGPQAVGMMALAPGVAAELGVDPLQPQAAIDGGARRLGAMAARLSDPATAVAAYRSSWRLVSDPSLVPQDSDTKRFVAAVLAVAQSYATPTAG